MLRAMPPRHADNLLIQGLPAAERQWLLERCESVELPLGQVLWEPRQPLQHLYFPQTACIALRVTLNHHPPLEMGLLGNEGMLGATLALGLDTAPLRAVVQGAGSSLRVAPTQLHDAPGEHPTFQQALHQQVYRLLEQLSQTAACIHFHPIEPRLALWLLMIHDRAHADHFQMTHECLANMLGVRRSGVTVAAGALQQRRLIRYSRGQISILDRPGLEAACCECYAALNPPRLQARAGIEHAANVR